MNRRLPAAARARGTDLRVILRGFLVVLMAGGMARATTLQRMSLEELAAAAPAIARVRCITSESRWENGRIWTFTTAEVLEPMKGALPARIILRMIGGQAGSLHSKVEGAPRFAGGEEVILFLAPTRRGDWTVVSWAQGTFRVHHRASSAEERVTQDTAGVALFHPATRRFEEGGVRNLSLREFRERLARVLAHEGGTRR
jgi:hypothetical protein